MSTAGPVRVGPGLSEGAGAGPPGREAGRTDLVEELLGPEHVHHVVGTDFHGRDAVREMADRLRTTFPDLRFDIDESKAGTRWW